MKKILLLFHLIFLSWHGHCQDSTKFDATTKPPPATNDSLLRKGQADAKRFYSKYTKPGTATLFTTMFAGPIGGITALACRSNEPKTHNLGYPDPILMQNDAYYKGYSQEAFAIKKKKVWKNFVIGIMVFVPATIIYLSKQPAKGIYGN